ncbi:MAG TPA: hypothetical protein VFA82_06315 [Gaiellaceae bacterium]|nr:hypothetical protein [Gaiellaceae bacterium]
MSGAAAQIASGLAGGVVYGLLALAVVLGHRATGVVNLAVGAQATLSAYVCAALVGHGWALWPAAGATVALSFAGGIAVHALLVRPLQRGQLVEATLLSAGLLLVFAGLAAWIWGGATRPFPQAFAAGPATIAGQTVERRDLLDLGVGLAAAAAVWLALARTRAGLGLRAAAASPLGARYLGVPVRGLTTAAWGLAAAVAAVAGLLAASRLGLQPALLRSALLAALAAAAAGGLDSAGAAVPAGLALGVGLELAGRHVHWLHGGVRPALALAVLAFGLAGRRR